MNRYLRACVFSSLLVSLFGCAGAANRQPATQFDIQFKEAPRIPVDAQVEKSSSAMHHYLVGQLSYGEEDFKNAMENFGAASDLLSHSEPELHSKLAELYIRSGELDKALEESKKSLEPDPTDASRLLVHAGILESLGRYVEAEPVYRQVISTNATLIDAYILLSSLYIKTGKVDQAITLLTKLVKQSPEEAASYYYLAHAYEAKGDLGQAEQLLRKAHEKNQSNSELAMDLVRILLKSNKVAAAKELCEKVLERDPHNLLARRVIGQIMIGESNFDDALKHLQVLETLEQDSAETRFKVALIQIQKQNYREAITELNLVIAQNPEHVQARYYLATIYAASRRRKEALEELFKIPQSSDMFVKSRMFAAFVQREDGDLAGAEKSIRSALEVASDNKQILSYLILILRERHDFSAAEKLLKKAVDEDPKNDRLLFQYAVVLHDLDREPEALQMMERVVQLNPKHSDALNYLAYGLADNGSDLKRAHALVSKALEVKPNDGYYLDTLGWVYFKEGNYIKAEEILGKAVAASEEDLVVLEHYADCLAKLGKNDKALLIYAQAIDKGNAAKADDNSEVLSRCRKKIEDLLKLDPSLVRPKILEANAR